MKKVYLITVLLLIINYIFFIDVFQNEITSYKAETEKLMIIESLDKEKDEGKDITELTGLEIIEKMESYIFRNKLTSINKIYTQSQDVNEYKLHELDFVLEGNKANFRKFIQEDVFQEEYNIQEISIYKQEDKELMKVSILVRTL